MMVTIGWRVAHFIVEQRWKSRAARDEICEWEEPVKTPVLALAFLLLSGGAIGAQTAQVTVKPLSDDDIKLIRQDIQSQKDGIIKDTIVVPYYGRAVVDFTADQPGLTLFHCHIQQHMDYGFKALFRYA